MKPCGNMHKGGLEIDAMGTENPGCLTSLYEAIRNIDRELKSRTYSAVNA